jgi:cellulose 1,4-beta-cellobiosidase
VFAEVYRNASKPAAVRGIVTNVSNYNAYNVSQAPDYAKDTPNWDESRYHASLTPFLKEHGYPANFLVDTGRNGQQPAGRTAWGQWCNIKSTGFGIRPSSQTGTDRLDAYVWVKPGGEADGTSDETAARFDTNCRSNQSMVPAPEAGAWFQEYFVQLLELANPPF